MDEIERDEGLVEHLQSASVAELVAEGMSEEAAVAFKDAAGAVVDPPMTLERLTGLLEELAGAGIDAEVAAVLWP